MKRQYLISETSVQHIKKELDHLYHNCTITPDTDANYKSIVGILNSLRGA